MDSSKMSKHKMIPISIYQKLHMLLSDFNIYIRNACLLPSIFYHAFVILSQLQSSFTLMLVFSQDAWPPDNPLTIVFKLLLSFIRLSYISTEYNDMLIQELVLYSLFLICTITIIIALVKFRTVGRISSSFVFLICFLQEIIIPFILSTFPTSIGTFIGILINNDKSIPLVFTIICLIVRIVLFLSNYIICHIYIYSPLAYYVGRSITWSGPNLTYVRLTCEFMLLVTRIAELTTGKVQDAFLVICLLATLGSLFLEFYTCPFINKTYFALHCALQTTFTIVLVLAFARIKGCNIPLSAILMWIIFGLFVLMVVFTIVMDKIEHHDLNVLKKLSDKEIKFKKTFSNFSYFLRCMRLGFKNGDHYVLSWAPFEKGLKKWPNSLLLYMQYIRFVAIFIDQSQLLMRLHGELKKNKRKKLYTKIILSQVMKVLSSRNRHMSKELKANFKKIDEKVRQTKVLLVSYWNAVIDNSSSGAYNIAKRIQRDFTERDSDFQHLINLYPNNHAVCAKYSQFLLSIVCDPTEALFWELREKYLKSNQSTLIDVNQKFGMKAFPLLPRMPTLEQSSNYTTAGAETMSISVNSHNSSSSDSSKEEMVYDTTPSNIRFLGMNAQIGFIQIIYLIAILFYIISYFLTPFLPSFITLNGTKSITKRFNPITVTSRIYSQIVLLDFFFDKEAMRNHGILASKDQENMLLKSNCTIDNQEIIESSILLLNELSHNIQAQFGQDLPSDEEAGVMQRRFQINVIKSGTRFNVSLYQAMNLFSSQAFKYIHGTDFINESWYNNFIDSSESIFSPLAELVTQLCLDIPGMVNRFFKVALYSSIACVVVSILLYIFYLITVFRIKSKWNYIIKTINSVPRVAIQNFLTAQTQKQEEELSRSEIKYSSTFTQMIASRDSSSGLPMGTLSQVGTINLIFTIVSTVIILIIVKNKSPEMSSIGIKYYYLNNLMHYYFKVISNLLRYHVMNETSKYSELKSDIDKLKVGLNDFMFSTWGNQQSNYLSTSKNVTNFLLEKQQNWFEPDNFHDELDLIPRAIELDVVSVLADMLIDHRVIDPLNDSIFIFPLHFVSHHIYSKIMKPLLDQSSTIQRQTVDRIITTIFLISSFLFIIGTCLIFWVIHELRKVELAVKFVLSSLSMLKPHYIKDSQNVMNLLSGQFKITNIHNHSLDAPLHKVEEIVNENVITVDQECRVKYFNESVSSRFNLTLNDWNKAHLSLIVEFEDHSLAETIERIAKYGNPKSYSSNSPISIKIPSSQLEFKLNLIAYHIEHSSSYACVIIFMDQNIVESKQAEIEEIVQKCNQMKYSVIPVLIRDKFVFNEKYITVSSHHVFIIAFELINFNHDYQSMGSSVYNKMRGFRNLLQSTVDNYSDMIVMNHVGTIIYVFANFIKQSSNSFEIATSIIKYTKEIVDSGQYPVKIGLSLAKNIKIGFRAHNSLQLDYLSKAPAIAFKYARSSEEGSIVMNQTLYEYLPIQATFNSTQIQILIDEQLQWVRIIKLKHVNL